MKRALVHTCGWLYRHIARPVFFLFDSEPIHDFFVGFADVLGRFPLLCRLMRSLFFVTEPSLRTEIAGIAFANPVGLAAGFDAQGNMPRMLSGLGFGFGSIGTVTARPYEGNPYPRLKRLARSRSLLVNKGFKSRGMPAILEHLGPAAFDIPIGISIGRTNDPSCVTHGAAIADILSAFRSAAASSVPFAYYELNISCPNMLTPVEFYAPDDLRRLLRAIGDLRLAKPLFLKMPISRTDDEIRAILDVAMECGIAAVILGNLQHDRTHPALVPEEVATIANFKGNMSGAPCEERSTDLVALAYAHTKGKLPIIGCGGIFTAEDAYRKIRSGASLVMLATGLVFMGPLLPAEISADLARLLNKDGFANVREAVGM